MSYTHHLLLFLFVLTFCTFSHGDDHEIEALIKFKELLTSKSGLLPRWSSDVPPCHGNQSNWEGIICANDFVWGIRLVNMDLSGTIDIEPLRVVPELRSLNFMNNSFTGTIPSVNKLGALKSLYLSKNRFSGEIPGDWFSGMGSLKKVYLSENDFSGSIPESLARTPKLLDLKLEMNNFSGEIPEFPQQSLRLVNLSHNALKGMIPVSLRMMSASCFNGNEELCGEPLNITCSLNKRQDNDIMIVVTVVTAVVLLIAVVVIFVYSHRCREALLKDKDEENKKKVTGNHDYDARKAKVASRTFCKREGRHELVFVREDREKFDLEDLLRASAELLGSGRFGSSYKTTLLTGPCTVVKRFREMSGFGREEFNEHMRRLGGLNHPNVLPLIAFYYRREEKLLVLDYATNGSLAHLLHGSRSSSQPKMYWPTRLKIIKGVARGLLYLYNELPTVTLPHGHLKTSNVLLDECLEPLLTDYALAPVMNKEHATKVMVAYKSPEFARDRRVSRKSDVWSLGILILEILTGKFPTNYLRQDVGETELDDWIHSIAKDKGMKDVFDSEMNEGKRDEDSMFKLLQIGLQCCEKNEEKRWPMEEVAPKIEEIKEMEIRGFSSIVRERSLRLNSNDEVSIS